MVGSTCFPVYLVIFTIFSEGISVIQGTINSLKYSTECKLSVGGHRYAGTLSTTISGFTCQSWSSKQPHYQTYMNDPSTFPGGNLAASSNYCRNPEPNWHGGPWCYTMNHTERWQPCDVGFCECKVSTTGLEYGGQKNVTVNGRPCQSWSRQSPHSHTYTHGDQFLPDVLLADAANYCRNPSTENGSRPDGPWCYTTIQNIEWEYCNVQPCDFELVTVNPPTTTTVTTATTTTTPVTTTTVTTTTPTTTATATTRRRPTTTRRPTTATTQKSTTTTRRSTYTTTISTKAPSVEKPENEVEGPDGKPAASTSKGLSTTVIIASVVCVVVVVVVGAVVGVVLYKRVFKKLRTQGGKEKLEECFDNPSFNVEKSNVDISHIN